MGLKSIVKKYKAYEAKEITRRAIKKKKIAPYKSLKNKAIPVRKAKRKFSTRGYTQAIGNPYGTKFPKAKKVLKRVRKRRRKRKPVVIYK